ncbi:hypothetical protein SCOR_30940 [Sulfidibacter corallicola]|uniref:Uncharacterized protein n=1 Tax=Sulfidibacter corallicola TaxID=2818388 RepID=A0A8A4TMC7_SULCO|nr:hypothetical protein [Sulfidibacter corallicola]QTD50031.1 hypothetical protein J3U87_30985 [Sulfidibacter corallicola]
MEKYEIGCDELLRSRHVREASSVWKQECQLEMRGPVIDAVQPEKPK